MTKMQLKVTVVTFATTQLEKTPRLTASLPFLQKSPFLGSPPLFLGIFGKVNSPSIKIGGSKYANNFKQLLGAPAQTRHYFMHGHMVDLQRCRATSGERNFIERIKDPIFLEAVLATKMLCDCQFNLEEKVNPSILEDFSSGADPSIFISIAPVLLDWLNETI